MLELSILWQVADSQRQTVAYSSAGHACEATLSFQVPYTQIPRGILQSQSKT